MRVIVPRAGTGRGWQSERFPWESVWGVVRTAAGTELVLLLKIEYVQG
jgi:hypothetical protein